MNNSHAAHAAASFEGPYGSSHHRSAGGGGDRLSSFGDVISEGDYLSGGGGGDGDASAGSSSSGSRHLRGEAKENSSYPMSLLVNMGRAIGE